VGDHSSETFKPLWEIVIFWKCYFYVTNGWSVYPHLARLHRKTLCYSKSVEMLRHSIRLLVHYLKFWDVPVPA